MVDVIYELGINHNGDLKLAKKMIDVAHAAGCRYVKFQKRNVDLVYSKEELDTPRESPWGKTTREQKLGLEFNFDDYKEIDAYCKEKVKWFASPWDLDSVAFLTQFRDTPYIKVPSALITNGPFLEACRSTGKPVILSTGMSTPIIIDNAISTVGEKNVHCIMHCTSTYPTDPAEINMKYISVLKEKYPWAKIGFSNHYPGLTAMEGAVFYGAEVLEFHGTLDRAMYGSDQAASIEPRGVFELMERLYIIEQMIGNGFKGIFDREMPILAKLRR